MNITPLDIQQKQFHMVFRGYDRIEVEMFLDLVRDEMETLVREVTEQREFRQSYDQRLRELIEKEDTVKNTMLMTQKLMEDQKDNARREAAVIIKEAEFRSQQVISASRDERMKLDLEIQELNRKKHHFLQDLKKVIQMHQEMVNFETAGTEQKDEPTAE